MSLWGQIKQRRITQVVLTYLAGGWMFLAVVDQVVDREVLPVVVYQVALTLYLFGITWALILGWYHGEKGNQQATKTECGAPTNEAFVFWCGFFYQHERPQAPGDDPDAQYKGRA